VNVLGSLLARSDLPVSVNEPTCVDLVEDCTRATFIHCLWLSRYLDGDPSFVDSNLCQPRCSLLRWRSTSSSRVHDRLRQQTWLQLLNVYF